MEQDFSLGVLYALSPWTLTPDEDQSIANCEELLPSAYRATFKYLSAHASRYHYIVICTKGYLIKLPGEESQGHCYASN